MSNISKYNIQKFNLPVELVLWHYFRSWKLLFILRVFSMSLIAPAYRVQNEGLKDVFEYCCILLHSNNMTPRPSISMHEWKPLHIINSKVSSKNQISKGLKNKINTNKRNKG